MRREDIVRHSQAWPTEGRRVLAAASAGGHFKQLLRLVDRLTGVESVTWLTYDSGLSRDLLVSAGRGEDPLVHVPYAAPRDVMNLVRGAHVVRTAVRDFEVNFALSTGAGIAVATLPLARIAGARAIYIESATRAEGPSLSGRILQSVPGIELYSQHAGYGHRWRQVASVHDDFEPGPLRPWLKLERVVVSLGTIRPYGFRRLLERLLQVLPSGAEVLWQTGATDVTGLPIESKPTVPAPEFEAAISEADLVIAHAGTGTAMTAFEYGQCPVLVPRRSIANEHVDDHQVATARSLSASGLAVYAEVNDLTTNLLVAAARRSVTRRLRVPALRL